MLSFELNGGEEAVCAFIDGLHCFTLANPLAASKAWSPTPPP